MGQKVNPHGLRVGVIKNWDSRWYAKDETFGDTLVSDYKLRKYLKKRFFVVFRYYAKPRIIIRISTFNQKRNVK